MLCFVQVINRLSDRINFFEPSCFFEVLSIFQNIIAYYDELDQYGSNLKKGEGCHLRGNQRASQAWFIRQGYVIVV